MGYAGKSRLARLEKMLALSPNRPRNPALLGDWQKNRWFAEIKKVVVSDAVDEIPGDYLELCASLNYVEFREPSKVETIGSGAFRSCIGLQSIVLPNSLRDIGVNAFDGCANMQSVTLNDGLKNIGVEAFKDCLRLEYVIVPNSVRYIGAWAFKGCENLRHVFLPRGLEKLGSDIFKNCGELSCVYYHPTTESVVLEELAGISDKGVALIPLPEDVGQFPTVPMTPKTLASDLSIVTSSASRQIKIEDIERLVQESRRDDAVEMDARQAEAVKNNLVEYYKLALQAELAVQTAARYLLHVQQGIKAIDLMRTVLSQIANSQTAGLRKELNELGTQEGIERCCKEAKMTARKPLEPKAPEKGAVRKPELPRKPKEPQYEQFGLFNKKKVAMRNQELKESYEAALANYSKAMEERRQIIREREEERDKKHAQDMEAFKEKKRAYDVALAAYEEERLSVVRSRKAEIEAEIAESDFADRVFDSALNVCQEEAEAAQQALSDAVTHLESVYSCNIVFPKYRSLPAVATMCEYLETGRCSELSGADGAYNLYESEIRTNRVIAQLDAIQDSLLDIKNNQYLLYEAVQSLNSSISILNSNLSWELKNIGDTISAIGDAVGDIKHATATTAYFAEKSVEIASKEKMFFGFTF